MNNPSVIVSSILNNPRALTLPGNRAFGTKSANELTCKRLETGHVVLYGPLGRRMLMTDPDGHPLHECEWEARADGTARLVSARFCLDWGQWVGLKPNGLVHAMQLDLTSRPEWQALTRHDLRMMASRAMGVGIEEVGFFYADDDLMLDGTGHATIRQRKDAFYVLEDGAWERARFMSCMSAMHWATIDYLPVVELFKSLLPGTGSAAFELIRGLYDDQNAHTPKPLRYRGIPTYPSAAAFGLFSNFFTATHRGEEDAFAVFMDPPRSHEVEWLPNPHPPVRYIDPHHRICLTVKQGNILKVTKPDDADGLSFTPPNPQGFAPCGKRIAVNSDRLLLYDHKTSYEIPLQPSWGIRHQTTPQTAWQVAATGERSWEGLFPEGPPVVSSREAYSAVLLYPEDDVQIGELASQPFVADLLNDFIEQDRGLAAQAGQAGRMLIHGFDGVIGTLLPLDRPRSTTILYSQAAHAQKHAQAAWNRLALNNRLEWQGSCRFLSEEAFQREAYRTAYDLAYVWLPFVAYHDTARIQTHLSRLSEALRANALACLAGPDSLASLVSGLPLEILFGDRVSESQPFQMHRSILPKATLNPRLFVWILRKSS